MNMNLNRAIKMTNNYILEAFLKNRSMRVYRNGIDGRLGLIGLNKMIKRITGQEPHPEEVYVFFVKNRDVVKILKRDLISMNIMEFRDEPARDLKEYFLELGWI